MSTNYVYRLLILGCIVLPWAFVIRGSSVETVVAGLSKRLSMDLALSDFAYLHDSQFWGILVILSTPHVFYFFVWTNANKFHDIFKTNSVLKMMGEPFEVFARLAHSIKVVQFSAFAAWYLSVETPDALKSYLLDTSWAHFLLCAQCVLFGQFFNAAVYKAIGEAGVYYGCRLGVQVPWVDGFPYNAVPHAQYLGASLSFWGMFLALATPAAVASGILTLGAAMTIFYTFSSYVEQCLLFYWMVIFQSSLILMSK